MRKGGSSMKGFNENPAKKLRNSRRWRCNEKDKKKKVNL